MWRSGGHLPGVSAIEKVRPQPTARRPWGSRAGGAEGLHPRSARRPGGADAGSSRCHGHGRAGQGPAQAQKTAARVPLPRRRAAASEAGGLGAAGAARSVGPAERWARPGAWPPEAPGPPAVRDSWLAPRGGFGVLASSLGRSPDGGSCCGCWFWRVRRPRAAGRGRRGRTAAALFPATGQMGRVAGGPRPRRGMRQGPHPGLSSTAAAEAILPPAEDPVEELPAFCRRPVWSRTSPTPPRQRSNPV